MTKVTIDNRIVIYSGTLVLRDNQRGAIEIQLPLGAAIASDLLKLAVRFSNRQSEEIVINWRTENGVVEFELSGWKNKDGTVTGVPMQFGEINNRPLFFELAQQTIGSLNVAHIVISQGE